MRPLLDMDTIQIEITNQCHKRCSNCTRLIGHHKRPYFMDFEDFKKAVDSMADYPKMTGMMGGEPLFHPEFERFCEYMGSKITPDRCGLWTCFPNGKEYYRDVIVKTFGHVFLNDQSRDDILHGPILVASQELEMKPWARDYLIDKCWVQNSWSACINPHGAFFCEVAGALSILLEEEGAHGWPVKDGWWHKVPKDFVDQMERYCYLCGAAMPLKKRSSCEGPDDISPGMIERLKDISPKVKQGKYIKHDLKLERDERQIATYKDEHYRAGIAARYGIFLMHNDWGFQTPFLKKNYKLSGGNDSKLKEHEVIKCQ